MAARVPPKISDPRSLIPDPLSPISNLLSDPYRLLLLAAVFLSIWIFTDLAFDLHAGMRTHKADLGQMDQAIWNTSRGRFVESVQNDYVSTRLTDHVEPIFALISPIFWIWDDVRALLLLQVVAVAAGALPLYALAREKLDQLLAPAERRKIWRWEPVAQLTRPIALALALAYLLAPQLQSAVLTEFHAIPLAVPLVLWAFWAVEKERWIQFAVAALLVTSVKEEAALLGAGLGAWALWRIIFEATKRRGDEATSPSAKFIASSPRRLIASVPFRIAIGVTVVSLVWFYLTTFVIVPAHAAQVYDVAESSYFARYGALGNSPADIFKSFFTQPGLVWQIATEPARVDYLLGLLFVFGFTSLLAPEIVLLCLPVLLANLLSAYPAQYYGEFHYSAPLVPYFAVAAVYGTARLWRILARRAHGRSEAFQHMSAASAPVMALASLFTNSQSALRPLLAAGLVLWHLLWAGIAYADAGRGPLGGRYDPTPVTEHHRLLARFVAQIPDDAAVSATAAVHPHVSHRRYVYQFPWGIEPLRGDDPAPDNQPAEKADWALLDVTTNTDMAPGDLRATVEHMLARDWGVVDAAHGFLLLRKGAAEKTIPDAFYDFARVKDDRRPTTDDRAQGAPATTDVHNSQFTIHNSQFFGPLTFLGVELADWPRWRQTKVTTLWQVTDDFTPGSVRPWMEIRAPDGEILNTFDQIAPPALVWYPPELWQPGEVIRIETLWLFLPRVWGVAAGVVHGPDPGAAADRLPVANVDEPAVRDESGTLALAAAFARQADDTLRPLPVDPSPLPRAVRHAAHANRETTTGSFGNGAAAVEAWIPTRIPAGQPLDLWLRWHVDDPSLLSRYQPFIHLRRGEEIVSQSDGLPRYFLPLSPNAATIPDWRQLPLPADFPAGDYDVVAGLFDPTSGERLRAFDAGDRPSGNELLLGRVTVRPPLVPDQACALIPPACASQVE